MDKETVKETIHNQAWYYKEEWAKLELLELQGKLTPKQRGDAIVLLLEEVKERIFKELKIDLYN